MLVGPHPDAPAHHFDLAHDRKLGAEAFGQRLVFGRACAHGFFENREGAGLQGVHRDTKILLLDAGRDHHDGSRPLGHDPLRGFKAIHTGQADIHGNDIRSGAIEKE